MENRATEIIAKQYLEVNDYPVIAYEGCTDTYTLEKWILTKIPYSQYWEVQIQDPSKFIGKVVSVEQFLVHNHPLDYYVGGIGKTRIWVFVIEGNCVGGFSLPVTEQPLTGGVYSIDGRSWEQIHSNDSISYLEWKEQWNKRFAEELIIPDEVNEVDVNDN